MNMRAMVLLVSGAFAAAALAAPGEQGGAYGGDTTGKAGDITFQKADGNGDGVVSEQEARLVGIEEFKLVDRNHDGVLDEAEIAALETGSDGVRDAEGGSYDDGAASDKQKP